MTRRLLLSTGGISPSFERVKLMSLQIDWGLFPRGSNRRDKETDGLDGTHVSRIAEVIRAGEKIPPILVDRKTRKVVDGFHRWHAHLEVFGQDGEIDVEFRDFPGGDAEILLVSAEINSKHGKPLDRHDIIYTANRLLDMKVGMELISKTFHISLAEMEKWLRRRTAFATTESPAKSEEKGNKSGKGNEPVRVSLKRSTQPFRGKVMTTKQVEGNEKASGVPAGQLAAQLINLLTHDLIDDKNKHLMKNLHRLHRELGLFFKNIRMEGMKETA